MKTQVVFRQKSNQIICLAHSKGKTHDFRLFKNSRTKIHKFLKVIADKGYQGIAKIHDLSETPIKKPIATTRDDIATTIVSSLDASDFIIAN